jgi:Carboxypeptidase regulatory-like domain
VNISNALRLKTFSDQSLKILFLVNLGFFFSASSVFAAEASSLSISQQVAPIQQFSPQVMPVGILVNGRPRLDSISVFGQENGEAAVNFNDWLLPFDELSKALGWKVQELDGQLDISTQGQKFRLSASVIKENPKLGRVIAVRDLAAIPGYSIKFDINQYALDITQPGSRKDEFGVTTQPIVLEGLPATNPSFIGLSILEQRVNISGTSSDSANTNINGELLAVGNVGDASWFMRLNQSNFTDTNSWNISEFSILRQRPDNDILIGSQTPFWQLTSGSGNYWGATTVLRQGFDPPVQFGGGSYSLTDRLQARRTTRTISGIAQPGTIVQLVRNNRTQLLQEVLVDSSGVFRFNNIPVSGGADDIVVGRDYQLLLYPRGILSALPTVREVSFNSFSGQIPTGAQAWVFSAGASRISSGAFGNFDQVQGGALYRRGLNDSLTVGLGIAYDREIRGIGEIFWQPTNPLEISLAAITDSKQWQHLGRINYRPSENFYAFATSDQFSTSASTYWQLSNNLALINGYDSRRGVTVGGQYFFSDQNFSTALQADIDTQGRIRASLSQRLDNLQGSIQTNESSNNAQLTYRLDGDSNSGSEFILGYQSSNSGISSQENTALWRYRSPEINSDGRSLWQTELGYGWGTSSNGIIANADLNFIPGVTMRASYRTGIGSNSQDAYAIELTTALFTGDGRIRGTFDRVEEFRTFGKVVVQAFLDKNQNGRQDAGEESYWDPLLLRVNEKPLVSFSPRITDNRAELNLPNGSYRVDVDPAGYPISYSSRLEALRVNVVSGGVTTVQIPLIPAYGLTGFVKNTSGETLAGARVEAVNIKTKVKVISISNDAGFYSIENLEQGEYKLTVSGFPTTPDILKITPNSPPGQNIDLTVKVTDQPSPPVPVPAPPTTPKPANLIPPIQSHTPKLTANLPPKQSISLIQVDKKASEHTFTHVLNKKSTLFLGSLPNKLPENSEQ